MSDGDGTMQEARTMTHEPADTQQGRPQELRAELEELRGYVAAVGLERIKDGTWFDEFVRAMLHAYHGEAAAAGGNARFAARFPGQDGSTVADALVEEAARRAALAGGASGLATGAVLAAAFATAGVSLAAVPAVAGAALAELLYTARLQVRLVYDLAALAGYPLDPDDPDDLYKIFALSYGVVFAHAHLRAGEGEPTPEARALALRRAILGEADAERRAGLLLLGPQIGRAFIGEALASNVVPVAGAVGWSYLVTRRLGAVARFELRALRELRAAVEQLAAQLDDSPDAALPVLDALLEAITADGVYTAHEQEVFQSVVVRLARSPERRAALLSELTPAAGSWAQALAAAGQPLRDALAEALLLVAAADGEVVVAERERVLGLVQACGRAVDAEELERRAALFRRPAAPGDGVLDAARSVGAAARRWGQATLGLLRRRPPTAGAGAAGEP
jgi:tellurite resistance protein